jgi:hypothetical protein
MKKIYFYIFCCAVVCYVLGFSLGVAKIVLFQSTEGGKYALVSICDTDPWHMDENDRCDYHSKFPIPIGEAAIIKGKNWGIFGGVIGLILGLVMYGATKSEEKYNKEKHIK